MKSVLKSRAWLGCAIVAAAVISCSDKKQEAPVALTVNGEAITQAQVDEAAEFFRRQQMILTPEQLFDANDGELRKSAARQLAANILMLEAIKSKQWTADSAAIEAATARFIAQFPDRDIFLAQLAAMGESEESMRKGIEEEILLDSLLNVISSEAGSPDEAECREHYEKNKSRYVASPRVRASHIIFALNFDADSTQVRQVMGTATQVLEKAKAGEDFDALIKTYSSQPKNGDMGWFKKGDLIPDLEHVIFSLKKGGISDLVPSSMGIHIIKKTDEEEPRPMNYEEVSESIKKTLEFTKKGARLNSYVDSLLAAAEIKYIDTSLIMERKPERPQP
jgi:parvulin-like peptidyl-prolyl isomerase